MKDLKELKENVSFAIEYVEDKVILSSSLILTENDLSVLESLASVYNCSVGDVVLRCINNRISAYNFVHERLKPLFEANEKETIIPLLS